MLKGYFEKLNCKHQWEVLADSSTVKINDSIAVVVHTKKVLVCKNCGKLKTIEV